MNEQIDVQGGGRAGLWGAVALVVAGVAGYYVLSDQPGWLRWLVVAAGLLLGIGVFAASRSGKTFWQFVLDARNELRKVFWPSKNETWMTTLVVFVFAVTAGLFFWLLDLFLAWATRHLTGQGG
jgi:preprotein translocase subunit SecE